MKNFKWIIAGLALVVTTGCTIDITPRGSYYYHGYDRCDDYYYYSPGIYIESYHHGHHGYHGHHRWCP